MIRELDDSPQAQGGEWRMVPVEPTEAMLRVGTGGAHGLKRSLWSEMLSAAPLPAHGGEIAGWRMVDGVRVFSVKVHSAGVPDQEFVRYDDFKAATPQRAPGVDEAMVERAWIAVGGDRELRASDRDASRRYVERVLEAALAAPVSAGGGEASRYEAHVAMEREARAHRGGGVLNLRGVLHEALAFVLDHADKDEDAEKWTLTQELRRHIALTSGASGVDWRGQYRLQTAMRYMDNRPELTIERAYAMADEDIRRLLAAAPAHQGQGERGEGNG